VNRCEREIQTDRQTDRQTKTTTKIKTEEDSNIQTVNIRYSNLYVWIEKDRQID